MLTYEQLDEIKTRASKATAGPWDWNSRHGLGAPNRLVMWPSHEYGCDLDIEGEEADLDFIAHARTDIPALIAAIEASESARVKTEQERDALKDCEESAYQRGVSDERKRAEKAEFAARRALESKP